MNVVHKVHPVSEVKLETWVSLVPWVHLVTMVTLVLPASRVPTDRLAPLVLLDR